MRRTSSVIKYSVTRHKESNAPSVHQFEIKCSSGTRGILTSSETLSLSSQLPPASSCEPAFESKFTHPNNSRFESTFKVFRDRSSLPSYSHAHASDLKYVLPSKPSFGIDYDSYSSSEKDKFSSSTPLV